MNCLLHIFISTIFFVPIALIYFAHYRGANVSWSHRQNSNDPQVDDDIQGYDEIEPGTNEWSQTPPDSSDVRTLLFKELYFKIQNLEAYPEILPKARQTLYSLLSEGLEIECGRPRVRSILDIEIYSPEALRKFLMTEHNHVTSQWEQYIQRRAKGGAPELFRDRQSAIRWLKRYAPTKYVDGAWLGHIHKITTPYALRGVTKDTWQILSEELGDGDLEKNHVFLYAELLKEVGVSLPDGHDVRFTHPRHGLGNELTWKAGTTQLLISLFPHDFLPEILGFNMHFELLTIATLKASRELPEVGISGYYFSLHVSIDNADSGHTAMALGVVTQYLDIVRNHDPTMVQEVWKRIQAGYILSRVSDEKRALSDSEKRLIDMLRLKADASHQIHCASRVRIGQQTLAQWLSPEVWTDTEDCKAAFLQALANAKPWVIKGDSERSLLIRELSWKGRMFGAFTNAEVGDLQKWINSLESAECDAETQYWSVMQPFGLSGADTPHAMRQDVAAYHPVFLPKPALLYGSLETNATAYGWESLPELIPLDITNTSVDTIIPLWFVHPCLLENMTNVPCRTATPLVSHFIRLMRIDSGFSAEGPGVNGIDEQMNGDKTPDLISLGLEIVKRLHRPQPASLRDILGNDADDRVRAVSFSRALLGLAMRPLQNETLLIGLALAFVDFEAAVAARLTLLSTPSQRALQQIVIRKRAVFKDCLDILKGDGSRFQECVQHYVAGRSCIDEMMHGNT